jgi:hypothetical protein
MLFDFQKQKNGIDCFDPSKCKMESADKVCFEIDDVVTGCSDGCWDGCIGSCRRFQH